jgi:hypothetical protein
MYAAIQLFRWYYRGLLASMHGHDHACEWTSLSSVVLRGGLFSNPCRYRTATWTCLLPVRIGFKQPEVIAMRLHLSRACFAATWDLDERRGR